MSTKRMQYGKVFISHSSVNKPFVRKLVKAIEAAGFLTWLDEKELLPGDSLAQRVSEGVTQASAVIVVVSQAAIASKWLAFELNKAADRMVRGECLVIPVVMETVDRLPPEVQGQLYADFSKSFKRPLQAVLNALNSDVEKRVRSRHFFLRAEDMLDEVFDSRGTSYTFSEYKNKDEDLVYFNRGDRDEQSVAYETLTAYGSTLNPFTNQGVYELERAHMDSDEALRLIVSERPVTADRLTRTKNPNVHVLPIGGSHDPEGYAVFADVSSITGEGEWQPILKAAREVLEEKSLELDERRKRRRMTWATQRSTTLEKAEKIGD